MAAFIEDGKVERLARGFLKDQSFKTLLLPGALINPRQLQMITRITWAETAATNQDNQPSARELFPHNPDLTTFARSA
jgi:hypothetical protein